MPVNRINNKRTIVDTLPSEQLEQQDVTLANTNNQDDMNNTSDKPFINSNETVLSINLDDFNSRSDLVNSHNYETFYNINSINVNSSSSNVNNLTSNQLSMPDIKFITEAPKKASNAAHKRNAPIRFTRNLLWFPLIAFLLVALVAIVAGITYAILNYHIIKHSNQTLTDNTNNKNNINNNVNPIVNVPTDSYYSTTQVVNSKSLECGNPTVKPNLRQVRIIRGHDAVPHSWPWTVSIGYYGPRSIVAHACGGSLINKRTVVTATHCVVKESIFKLVGSPVQGSDTYGTVEAMMRIFVGINKRSTDINQNNTYYAVKILSFPGFNENTFQNDLTLITLDRDVEVSDDVGYICLSNNTNTSPGTHVYAVGWGFTEGNFFKASDLLMQVRIQIQAFDNCGLSYIPIFQFCAGNPQLGKDTCNGDSGGPIMEYINNRWVLTGIVSNGDSGCTGRGVYTNIAFYYNWIIQNS